jgi:hypothetical protein
MEVLDVELQTEGSVEEKTGIFKTLWLGCR